MSDTPRMKTAQMTAIEHGTGDVWRVGCDLEHELNAANIEIEEKRKDVVWLATEKAELEERIKRLEEAGDVLFENSYPSMWDLPAAADQKLTDQSNWLKAKEAKP